VTPTSDRKTDASGNPVYRIPEGNLGALAARIEKLNRRAKKLGMEPLILTETGEEFETLRKPTGHVDLSGRPLYTEYQVRYVLATVAGKCPKVNGWTFAATIAHDEAGNILRTAPDFEATLPLAYRTAGTACDHCRTDRRRNDTYVLRSDAGDWKQVGRNCLADFLRTENPAGLAEWAEVIASLAGEIGAFEDEGFGAGSGRVSQYVPTATLLTRVACCVRQDGWCSRTEARNAYIPKQASIDQALSWFDDKWVANQDSAKREQYTPSEHDLASATAAIAWAQEIAADVTNDYLWNIRVVAHREALPLFGRETGLAGSIIVAHQKHLERELNTKYEREQYGDSQHFGIIGERAVYALTVIGLRQIESDWGCTTMIRFRDASGNVAVWFASNSPEWDLDQTVTVKATVKKHEEYKGTKQTLLGRVVLHVEKPKAPRKAKQVPAEVL
jgi:hypothetical protein